jgi:hypothetical protein
LWEGSFKCKGAGSAKALKDYLYRKFMEGDMSCYTNLIVCGVFAVASIGGLKVCDLISRYKTNMKKFPTDLPFAEACDVDANTSRQNWFNRYTKTD